MSGLVDATEANGSTIEAVARTHALPTITITGPIVIYEQFKFFFDLYFLLVTLSQFAPAFRT
ncbi:hypothetical protein F5888DRAFT_1726841, partial [Russula emetica]